MTLFILTCMILSITRLLSWFEKTLKHHAPFDQLIPKLEAVDLKTKVTTDAVYVAIGSDDNLVQLRKVSDHESVCRLADNSNDDSPVIVENKICVM